MKSIHCNYSVKRREFFRAVHRKSIGTCSPHENTSVLSEKTGSLLPMFWNFHQIINCPTRPRGDSQGTRRKLLSYETKLLTWWSFGTPSLPAEKLRRASNSLIPANLPWSLTACDCSNIIFCDAHTCIRLDLVQ